MLFLFKAQQGAHSSVEGQQGKQDGEVIFGKRLSSKYDSKDLRGYKRMCGIAGILTEKQPITEALLKPMAAALNHRGPDDTGYFTHQKCGLAHTRLSIVDLSGGHQPLLSDDEQLALVANGEIYNAPELRLELEKQGRHFKTHSDCEVILHAYAVFGKDEFLKYINGMFAFALYDTKDQQLLLARDRIGMKPLFIAKTAAGFAFASEVKGLLPLLSAKEIEADGLIQYFQHQFSAGRQTLLKGVERVLPGEFITFQSGKLIERRKYWSALNVSPEPYDYQEAQDKFDGLMETVMQQHMRADVPFGLFLSGGVDSSILLSQLSRYHDSPIRTFSVGYPNTDVANELPVAQALAKQFNSEHTVLQPDGEATLHRLPQVVWAADELMRDNANMPTTLLAEEAGKELKVVFSGEGGDESFAGYGRYRTSLFERTVKNFFYPGSGGVRVRGTFRGQWPNRIFGERLQAIRKNVREPFIQAWSETPSDWDDLQRMQYMDLSIALPDNLMVKTDRMLMAHGVEGRLPFCDHRVVEFGLSLPASLKIEHKLKKAFLRHWASRFLPKDVLFLKKKGFNVPVGFWLKGETLANLAQILPKHVVVQEWLQPEGVRQLILQHGTKGGVSALIMAILQFALWHDMFITGTGERPEVLQDPIAMLMESR